MNIESFVYSVLFLVALYFWVLSLYRLMGLRDDFFPGRNDKVTWFVLLVLFNIVGAVMFFIFKGKRQPSDSPA